MSFAATGKLKMERLTLRQNKGGDTMKRILTIFLAMICVLGLLIGCSQNDENKSEEITVYSFCGENEQFVITNGVIVIGADEEIFYGGDLSIIDQEQFTDISFYSMKFYAMANGEKRTIMHNSVVDQTGGSINVTGNLGRIAGKDILTGNKTDNVSDLTDNLYFELITTDLSGKQDAFELQLTATKITK